MHLDPTAPQAQGRGSRQQRHQPLQLLQQQQAWPLLQTGRAAVHLQPTAQQVQGRDSRQQRHQQLLKLQLQHRARLQQTDALQGNCMSRATSAPSW